MRRPARVVGVLFLALSAAVPRSGEALTIGELASEVTPALPAAEPVVVLPPAFAVDGARMANGLRAFRIYVESVRDRIPEGGELGSVRRELNRWLESPASFRLRDSAGSAAFLELASRFAARRSLEPIAATGIGLIAFQTWRSAPAEVAGEQNQPFQLQMTALAEYLGNRVVALNAAQPDAEPLQFFEWRGPRAEGGEAWILGVRVGRGPRRFAVITHIDTVGPIRDDWKPFEGRMEALPFRGADRLFLRGRGSIDDKGPTAAGLHALDLLRSIYSGTPLFDECSFELLADTAEETHAMIPDYFDAVGTPEAGDVLDAAWSLYAEKGSERPIFRAPVLPVKPAGLHLVSMSTDDGPTNQIPDRAEAIFTTPAKGLQAAKRVLEQQIAAYLESDNERARLELKLEGQALIVTALGSGAAHGSAPAVNKEHGHNPVACLAAFTAGLYRQKAIQPSSALAVPMFLASTFGHNVFGEDHAKLLRAKDAIFTDGTTYALTRIKTSPEGTEARVDIRYALPHHAAAWDGKTFGTLPGNSHFPEIFKRLVDDFNATLPPEIPPVTFETKTGVGPDLKDPNAPVFQSLLEAYEKVVGEPSPVLAIGGGTDAKGYPMLYAAGPNFAKDLTTVFEAPVNYHGVDEAAPMDDLVRSTQILVRWFAVSGFMASPRPAAP